jgi:hypothetical protein
MIQTLHDLYNTTFSRAVKRITKLEIYEASSDQMKLLIKQLLKIFTPCILIKNRISIDN